MKKNKKKFINIIRKQKNWKKGNKNKNKQNFNNKKTKRILLSQKGRRLSRFLKKIKNNLKQENQK